MAVLILGVLAGLQSGAAVSDPVAQLQGRIKNGAATLDFDQRRGYLDSLLRNLKVPISSQTLVFSKTSLQTDRISPATPRAIYFNDDVYVAWAPGASLIEIMAVHPQRGSIFYMLEQRQEQRPGFVVSTGHECSVCHFARESPSKFVPKLLFDSVIPDAAGNVEGTFPVPVTDQSPFEERWGGWYVTGTHGKQRHLGNVVLKRPASVMGGVAGVDFTRSTNVTDLKSRFDASRYLSPHSDIVALMVLAHQIEVHNLIALAGGKPAARPEEAGEPLVRAMLFSGAAPLTDSVRGTSNFAVDFAGLGPRDSRGRSLRDFDLKTRLFRYPMSYLIYSRAFDGLPGAVKTYVYRRFREILNGADKSGKFTHLSPADRSAISEILRETKRDLKL